MLLVIKGLGGPGCTEMKILKDFWENELVRVIFFIIFIFLSIYVCDFGGSVQPF